MYDYLCKIVYERKFVVIVISLQFDKFQTYVSKYIKCVSTYLAVHLSILLLLLVFLVPPLSSFLLVPNLIE